MFFREKVSSCAVLIHGCHLEAEGWNKIMFGNGVEKGRVTAGIEEALKNRARFVIWGSGATQTKDGVLESEHTLLEALNSQLNQLSKSISYSPSTVSKYLMKASLTLKKERNTAEEISAALEICRVKKIKNLILISSPTHIARCLQESCKQKEINEYKDIFVYARSSDICYLNSTAADVLIVEPPHRQDRTKLPLHSILRETMTHLLDVKKEEFQADFLSLLHKQGLIVSQETPEKQCSEHKLSSL